MVQRHRLVDDELGQLIRNQDENEPAENDFRFLRQKTLRIPGSSERGLSHKDLKQGKNVSRHFFRSGRDYLTQL